MKGDYKTRPGADSYGFAVGVLLLDTRTPYIAGDVGNASTYSFPVLFRTVPGASVNKVLAGEDRELAGRMVCEAEKLERMGVRVIASNCGFMLRYQQQVAEAVGPPVILSSLLQLPLLEQSVSRARKIAVITADRGKLTDDLLALAGLKDRSRVVVGGMESQPNFRAPILDETGVLVPDKIEEEVIDVAKEMVQQHPDIGPLLLECSSFPPYSHAVQRATGRPVFDFITMINLFAAASFQTPFAGIY